jgi:23S rRNA (guanosine2251-2'-O)-methyltransferase
VKEVLALAREAGVKVRDAEKSEIERRAPGGNHQGILLVADELPVTDLEGALATEVISEGTIWVGLDEVTDPHNLGAVIRNAACFGAGAVLVTERRSARPTPLVQKIASGATEHVRIVSETNLNQSILRLRKEGFWIYGAEVEGKPLDLVKFHGPAFVLVGAEGRGLRKSTRSHAHELVRIPQAPGGVASLNASAAAAVVLYEVRRRLGPP